MKRNAFRPLMICLVGLLAGGLVPMAAWASVTMVGTRVIYPANEREVTIHLNNRDNHPNLVQVWLDTGDVNSTIETADAPFVVNPQVFRMGPQAGQVVRLKYMGSGLPQDRETLFYLNFSQIPPTQSVNQTSNQLVLMFENRLKVFYRPKGLKAPPAELPKQMQFRVETIDGKPHLHVENPTPWYAVVREASLVGDGEAGVLVRSAIIAPKSTENWPLPKAVVPSKGARLRLILVNDHGSDTSAELVLP